MDTVSITEQKKSKTTAFSVKEQTPSSAKANIVAGKSSAAVQGKSLSRMKVRRQSYGFSGVAGIRPTERRTSQVGLEYKRPPLIFLNTYQLDPRIKFHVTEVEKTINTVLDAYWEGHKYNIAESPGLAIVIAGEVMRNVKSLGFNRYRIIAVVSLVQKRAQSYSNAVAFLWDHERDGMADIHREITSAFIQVTVFGIYLD
ncbi:tctex1 domain-containing protein 1-like [Spodoptera litura]|uniref:Tctex1 domain-containing protein 1-like n=1 Tax=Spodoptera litura TaxID=69820 RepID=A0A9J7INB9_SPOLT|nr:tctex1 domain-containing protein 1-like [Spodoptera litura]